MAEKKSKGSLSKTAVWILLGLLILGLGGFGVDGVLNGSASRVARVGDKDVDINAYARALQNALNAETQARGESVTMQRAREIGLDSAVLSQLVMQRALDHEADTLGLSVGNENLRDQILAIPAFQGVDGTFDREAYRFALEQAGLSEAAFEDQLREETARTILQGAVLSGVVMSDTYAETLVKFVGETRSFTWARLGQSDLGGDLPEPSDSELQTYYDENTDEFQLPETKVITYASLRPRDLLSSIDPSEEDLRAEYDQRIDEFRKPERRLVERLPFLDETAANDAMAQIEVGGATFEALVEGRGLALEDVDLGDVSRLELDAAGEAVFSAASGEVVGPLQTSLGPALFRVNAILPAQNTTFEEARVRLEGVVSMNRARRLIETQAEDFEDILAGGATLEELAAETDMALGKIDWFHASGEGLAAYESFRQAATELTAESFPSILLLEDGGIFAMRLEDTLPERPAPFEEARDNVKANWEANRAEKLLNAEAEKLIPRLLEGAEFAALELTGTVEEGMDRGAFVTGTPPDFMSTIFEMEPGEVRSIDSFGTVLIVRLDAIIPASENPDVADLQDRLTAQTSQALSQNIFRVFANDTLLRAGQDIDQRALQAVHANFP